MIKVQLQFDGRDDKAQLIIEFQNLAQIKDATGVQIEKNEDMINKLKSIIEKDDWNIKLKLN